MAGKKGRSGGRREGAGRKPNPVIAVDPAMEPLEFLQGVMTGNIIASTLQVRAAVAAAKYMHSPAEEGKKQRKQSAAAQAGGKFARSAPPRLVASNGKSV